jgi:hypothetical protein
MGINEPVVESKTGPSTAKREELAGAV